MRKFATVLLFTISIPLAISTIQHRSTLASDIVGQMAGNCAALCVGLAANLEWPLPVCERICDAVEAQASDPCVNSLLGSSVQRLALLSYSSGHAIETATMLLDVALNASTTTAEQEMSFISGLHLNDRGSPEACAAIEDAHYCLGQGVALPVVLGLCLPRVCDSAAVARLVGNITPAASSSSTTSSNSGTGQTDDDDSTSASSLDPTAFFYCADEGSLSVDWGSIAVFFAIGAILFLVLIGTALEYRRSREHTYLKLRSRPDIAWPGNCPRLVVRACADGGSDDVSRTSGAALMWDESVEEGKEASGRRLSAESDEEAEERGEAIARRQARAAAVGGASDEFVANNGVDSTDDHGRQPLLARRVDDRAEGVAAVAGVGNGHEAEEVAWWYECLQCFSFRTNVLKLLAPPRPDDEFGALAGVRTLSMLWVLLGHTLLYSFYGPGFTNLVDVLPMHGEGLLARFSAQPIFGGFFAVDSFFLMSGFLLSSTLLPKLDAGSLTGQLWKLKVYLHRYLRLTPTIAFVTVFIWKVLPLLGQGAIWWPLAETLEENCTKYWWVEFVYLANVIPWPFGGSGCIVVTWYLANDMQFFLVGVPLVVLYYRNPRASAALVLLLAISSCFYTFWLGFSTGVRFSVFSTSAVFGSAYAAPWTRCPVYLIGLLCGFVWHTEFRGRKLARYDRNSEGSGGVLRARKQTLGSFFSPQAYGGLVVPALAVVSTLLLFLPVYGTYWAYQDVATPGIPEWADHLYLAFSRPAWAVGLALMCALCFCGHGGLVNWLLTRPGWTTPSRLTYCAYLTHPLLLIVLYGSRSISTRLTALELAVTYMGVAMGTFAGAAAMHLLIEAPFRNLEFWAMKRLGR